LFSAIIYYVAVDDECVLNKYIEKSVLYTLLMLLYTMELKSLILNRQSSSLLSAVLISCVRTLTTFPEEEHARFREHVREQT